jgi:putative N6-adenine-specific DNA methylase
MMNEKRPTEHFLAKTFAGLEDVLMEELEQLGAANCVKHSRSVSFDGDMSLLYKANYFCRTALRILWEMDNFSFRDNNQFYDAIYKFPAERFLSKDGTLAVSASLTESDFKTPLYPSVLAKDAICDRFRSLFDERPSVDKEEPDLQIHLHIYQNSCKLYLDSSGESLHKRGYKAAVHPAQINEVLAAAMIKLSGWHGECDFIDNMCGGGTLLIEAAMQALNIPAGYYRHYWGFFNWKNFDRLLWNRITNSARIKEDVNINFYGSDISGRYLGMARANVEEAELQDFIFLEKSDMADTRPESTPSVVMINPPYGERLDVDNIKALYQQIGDTWKQHFAGCTAFIISSDQEALKSIGLRPSRRFKLFNGPLECKFLRFDLYEGKKNNSPSNIKKHLNN